MKQFPFEEFQSLDWVLEDDIPEVEAQIVSEFDQWLEKLRDSQLIEKATLLWQLFKDGKLSGPDKALVVGALLYCTSPIDLVPDVIPLAGYLDDLFIVIGVLAYLEKKVG